MRRAALTAIVLLLLAPAAHAFDVESAPKDSHGAAFADSDAQFDDLSNQSQNGQRQTLNFGGVTTQSAPGGAQSYGAPTGAQLMDAGAIRSYRH